MSAETDLRTLLLGTPTITSLVGSRVTADRIEQGALRPFIVFTRTGTERIQALDGTVHAVKVVLELQCWADTRAAADAVAYAVTNALESVYQVVLSQDSAYDAELDLEAATLSVDWWQ